MKHVGRTATVQDTEGSGRPVRVLVFHPALAPYRVDLFNELSRHLDLKVVFLNENLVSQKFDQKRLRRLLEFEYGHLSSGANIFKRQVRWGIARAISEFKPNVVLTPEYSPTTLLARVIKSLGVCGRWGLVVWTDNNVDMCRDASVPKIIARWVSGSAVDGLIVQSEEARSWYTCSGVPWEAVGICPNVHNEHTFRKALKQSRSLAERFLQEHGLNGKRVVLSVCRLVDIKGVDRVIRAFARVAPAFPDAVLAIVGDGPERESLERLANKERVRDRTHFVGRLEGDALLAWYLLGHVFVLASDFEAFGAVVNEALLAGMPVLCSSAAGAADLVREGKNGHVFDPLDVSSLTNLLAAQLRESSPLSSSSVGLRQNLMPICFQDGVHDFVRVVEHAARLQRKSAKRG